MNHQGGSDEVSSESSSDDDNDRGELDLEAGAAAGNNAADGDSSSTSDDDDDDDDDDNEAVKESSKGDKNKKRKKPSSSSSDSKNNGDNDNNKKERPNNNNNKKKKKSKKEKDDDDIIQVDFTFCDMDEKYYHGIKNLLHSSSTVYQKHASQLTDKIVNQDIIGTIVSTDADTEGNAYGFATILQQEEDKSSGDSTANDHTSKKSSSSSEHKSTKAVTFDDNDDNPLEYLKDFCIKNCPSKQHRKQLEKALDRTNNNNKKKKANTSSSSPTTTTTTTTTTGFLIHGRTMNLPLEITLEMHKQLLLDMDWAMKHQRENENYNFSHFVRLAPCLKEKKNNNASEYIYKFYDDEIMASHSDVTYIVDAPTSYSKEEKQYVAVVFVSKKGYQNAVRDIEKMI